MTSTQRSSADELHATFGIRVEDTFSEQFAALAARRGDVAAIIDTAGTLTFAEVESNTNRIARLFAAEGVDAGDFVLLSSPVGSVLLQSAIAAWKLGAVPMPVSDRLVQRELDALVELGGPRLVIDTTDRAVAAPRLTGLEAAAGHSDAPLPPVVAPHLKAPTSGGSTGRPKLIVSGSEGDPAGIAQPGILMGVPEDGVCLVTAALYHNAPFCDALAALTLGSTAVIMERFDAEHALRLIEEHRATWVYAVPAMMLRIWKLPEEVRLGSDLSSVRTFFHVAAPCPPWLKRAWIDWLGADVIRELYGPTESQAATTITGEEWLAHPGSVGPPVVGELSIRDDSGAEVPVGEVGEVWMRRGAGEPATYHYLGAEPEAADDGWETVGDIGRVDADGYLYLSDRRGDMMLVGGVNVYPAEIEAAVDRHPDVLASCCVGIDGDDLGQVPALVVETADGRVPDGFDDFLADNLARVKIPRMVVATEHRLRDPAGKIRKREVRDAYLAV